MLKSSLTLSLFVLLSVSLMSCNPSQTVGFEKVDYVEDFPEIKQLEPDTVLNYGFFIHFFSVYDTLLVLETNATEGGWKVASLNDYQIYREQYNTGNGFGEFKIIPSCWQANLFTENDSIFAVTFDFRDGKRYKTNLSATDDGSHSNMKRICPDVPVHLDNYVYISDSVYVIRETVWGNGKPKKISLFNGEQRINIKSFDVINDIVVPIEDPSNILSASLDYSRKHDKLIMSVLNSNTINIMSLFKPEEYKSICLGPKMTTIDDAIELYSNPEIDETANCQYSNLDMAICCDEYFAIVTHRDIGYDEVLTFSYDGQPLCNYRFPGRNWEYQIDEKRRNIYALDFENSLIKRYPM